MKKSTFGVYEVNSKEEFTIEDGEIVYIPANEAGTDDVLEFGLTNPATKTGHNNSETKWLQPMAPELYSVPFAVVSDGVDDYIDTGFVPDENTDIELTIRYLTNGVNEQNGVVDTSTNILILGQTSANSYIVSWGDRTATVGTSDTNWHVHKIVAGDGYYIDGVQQVDLSADNWNTITNPIYLMARNFSTTLNVNADISSCKIWDNGTLVRDFVPIKKGDALGTVTATANGLYDSINDTAYYNQGTNDLGIYNGLMFDSDCNASDFNPYPYSSDWLNIHYIFWNIFTKDPIKFNFVMYGIQQLGSDLDDIYEFVKARISAVDVNNESAIDINEDTAYTTKL